MAEQAAIMESAPARLQRMSDEVKRLRKIVEQQKYTLDDNVRKYVRLKDELRDATARIVELETELERRENA